MLHSTLYVTQPYLQLLKEFIPLEQIWDGKILANGGPTHQRLAAALCDCPGVTALDILLHQP